MKRLMLAILVASTALVASAQDYMGPSVDYVGAHRDASNFRKQLERSQDNRGVGQRNRSTRPTQRSASTTPSRSLQQELAWIKPEYERRVRLDGKASADRWLTQTAQELGRRDGRNARRQSDGQR